jgi:hypothetical protein
LRAHMGEAGRVLVTERYDWSAIARDMTDSYKEAILSPIARDIS